MGRGFSVVELIVALAVITAVILPLLHFSTRYFQAKTKVEKLDDLNLVRKAIWSSIDCKETLAEAGISPSSPGANCNSTSLPNGQVAPFLRLRQRGGDGRWLTGAPDGNGDTLLGSFALRVSCSASEQSLIIRAAPSNQKPRDFYGEHSLLFGGAPFSLPLCFVPERQIASSFGDDALGAGFTRSCTVRNGEAKCWGGGSSTPVTVPPGGTGYSMIRIGSWHTCAIKNGAAFCWGENRNGALGSPGGDSATPRLVTGLSSGVTYIWSGNRTSCAIKDGAVYCWGSDRAINDDAGGAVIATGLLGQGPLTITESEVPLLIPTLNENVTAVSVGRAHACAIKAGAMFCWGGNSTGMLGNGSTTDSNVPVAVTHMGSNVTSIAANNRNNKDWHTCAVKAGAAFCWGNNKYGKLGIGSSADVNRTTPQPVTGLSSGVTAISIGSAQGCAIVNGAAKCWGFNDHGQLGDGTKSNRSSPVTAIVSGVTALQTGHEHSCALVDGETKCWGQNEVGQIGPNCKSSDACPSPKTVPWD